MDYMDFFNPANFDELENKEIDCLEVAIEMNDHKRVKELLSEVRKEVKFLRDYAKSNDNVWLLKRLNSIYNKL